MSLGEAVEIATDAVAESDDDIGAVRSSSARSDVRSGVRVWIVTLEGENNTATVVVDAASGYVLSLEVDGGN